MSGFGDRLRKARLQKHLTLVDVAEMIGVSHGAVAKWEQGRSRPRLKRLRALSDCLNVRTADLLGAQSCDTPEAILHRARERLADIWGVEPESVQIRAIKHASGQLDYKKQAKS